MGKMIPDSLLEEFSGFVEVNMGLCFPKEKRADLEKGLRSACAQFGCDNEEAFARHVMSADLSKRYIEMLASALTVGETYFFREKIALDAFEHVVLSELISTRSGAERNLRIWSAGCSSGEEPYTIAMMLKMLLPELKEWNVTILATDINPHFMEKALKGVYTRWSFRDVPGSINDRFFVKQGESFEILPEIKEMVTFSYLNLMKDDYPSLMNNTNAMDVIFCRNVLMYFSPETIKSVARNFNRCLTDGGRLIVSQTELNDEYFQGFGKESHAGALLFRKREARPEKKEYRLPKVAAMPETGRFRTNTTQKAHPPQPLPSKEGLIYQSSPLAGEGKGGGGICDEAPAELLYENARYSFEKREYSRTEELLVRLIEGRPGNAEALSLLARVCANQGRLDDALSYIEKAIKADKMNPGRHYLHSAILKEKGLKQQAIEALKKAVYLDADFALAYFAMGNLALGSGNMVEAERHFNSALSLLKKRAHDDILPESEGMTAGRLMELIESMKWRKKEPR